MMKRVEWLLNVLLFSLQCNALVPLLSRGADVQSQLGASNSAATIANVFTLLSVLVLMPRHAKVALRFAPGMWPVLCLVILAVLSAMWSDSPNVTIHRAATLATEVLWGWYAVTRYALKDVIAIIGQAFGLLALASLVVGAGSASLGRGPDGWLGVFSTKNDLGAIMALSMVTLFYIMLSEILSHRRKFLTLAGAACGFLLSAGLLYLSQSRTAWVTAALALVFCVVIKSTHKRPGVGFIVWTATVLLFVPAVVIAANMLGEIALMLGKDSSLTGRIDLWLLLPTYIAQAPILGHGYGAFWLQDSANVFQIWTTVGWEPPHAHNGWLDVLLSLGVVGFIPAASLVALILVNGARFVVEGVEPNLQFPLTTTFAILIHNLAESSLITPGPSWVLLVVASAALAKRAWERRAQRLPRYAEAGQRRMTLAGMRSG